MIEFEYKNELIDLKTLLRRGEVKFSYKKKDGTIRHAIGTLNEDLIPKVEKPVEDTAKADEDKPKRKLPAATIFYYDLEKKGFRSFNEFQFEGIDE